MHRPAVFAAIVAALLGLGFGVGYWSRGTQPPAEKAPTAATASDPLPPEPKVVVEPDELGAVAVTLPWNAVGFRVSGGPVTLRLRVYVDFVENGVKWRAVVRAEDYAPLLPTQANAAAFGGEPLFDVTGLHTAAVLDAGRPALHVGQVYRPAAGRESPALEKSNRVSFRWDQPWSVADPNRVPVLDYSAVEASSDRAVPFAASGADRWPRPRPRTELAPGSEVVLVTRDFPTRYRNLPATARVALTATAHPGRVAGVVESADKGIEAARAEVKANPLSGPARARLSAAITDRFKRFQADPATKAKLAEEAASEARAALAAEPGNVSYRVVLRDRLMDLAHTINDGTVPAVIEEALALVPPLDDVYLAAAYRLARWKPTAGRPGDTHARAVELLRAAFSQHRDDPEYLNEMIVRNNVFCENTQFTSGELTELSRDLQQWREEAVRPPAQGPPIPKAAE